VRNGLGFFCGEARREKCGVKSGKKQVKIHVFIPEFFTNNAGCRASGGVVGKNKEKAGEKELRAFCLLRDDLNKDLNSERIEKGRIGAGFQDFQDRQELEKGGDKLREIKQDSC
jgi:hypothetical protein